MSNETKNAEAGWYYSGAHLTLGPFDTREELRAELVELVQCKGLELDDAGANIWYEDGEGNQTV